MLFRNKKMNEKQKNPEDEDEPDVGKPPRVYSKSK